MTIDVGFRAVDAPEFGPSQRAFFCGRVIGISPPRWTACDAKYYGLERAPDARITTTERAGASPIGTRR